MRSPRSSPLPSSSFSSRRRRRSSRVGRSAARPARSAPARRRRAERDRASTCSSAARRSSTSARAIARVSLTVPDVADAMVTAPQQLLIHGKAPGIDLAVRLGPRRRHQDLRGQRAPRPQRSCIEQMQQLFPGEPITVAGSGKDVVHLRHRLQQVRHRQGGGRRRRLRREEGERRQPAEAAGRRRVQPGAAARALRRSEPQRAAGARRRSSSPTGSRTTGSARTTTQQFAAPDFDCDKPGGLTFSDFLNLFVFNTKHNIGAVVKALQNKGLFQSLAEPNLIAQNGKEASFLAGGEYPVSRSCSRAAAATPSRSCSRSSASA